MRGSRIVCELDWATPTSAGWSILSAVSSRQGLLFGSSHIAVRNSCELPVSMTKPPFYKSEITISLPPTSLLPVWLEQGASKSTLSIHLLCNLSTLLWRMVKGRKAECLNISRMKASV